MNPPALGTTSPVRVVRITARLNIGGPAIQAITLTKALEVYVYTTRVVTLVARLVPIKRVDRFLRIASKLADVADLRFLVVGDGELREQLRKSPEALGLGERVTWAGFRRDMAAVYFASDAVVQSSDNEGSPVSLIEAQAAGVPTVRARVGGSASVVGDERFLAAPGEEDKLANVLCMLIDDSELATEVGTGGRERVPRAFTLERLVTDIDSLYRALLQ